MSVDKRAWLWSVLVALMAFGALGQSSIWAVVFFVGTLFAIVPIQWVKNKRQRLGLVGKKASWIALALSFIGLAVFGATRPETPQMRAERIQRETKSQDEVSGFKVKPLPKPIVGELTADQESVVNFMRNIVLQTLSCRGDLDRTQDGFDKMAAGKMRPIDVYEEAKRGIQDCDDATKEFSRSDLLDGVPAEDKKTAFNAVGMCAKAAKARSSAMYLAQDVLQNGETLNKASRYRELRNDAVSEETSCRMMLMGLASRSKIPEAEVDWAAVGK